MLLSRGTHEDVVCSCVKCLEQDRARGTEQEPFVGLLVKEKKKRALDCICPLSPQRLFEN